MLLRRRRRSITISAAVLINVTMQIFVVSADSSGALKVCKIVVAVVELETVRKLHLASWGFGDMKVGHGNRGVDVAREIFIKTSLKLQRTGAMFLGSAENAFCGVGGVQWVE